MLLEAKFGIVKEWWGQDGGTLTQTNLKQHFTLQAYVIYGSGRLQRGIYFSSVANEMTKKLPDCGSSSHQHFWFKNRNSVGKMVKICYDSSNIFKFHQRSLCLVWIASLKEICSSFLGGDIINWVTSFEIVVQSFYYHHSAEP